MFNLSDSSIKCLGFITIYSIVVYWILSICLLIHGLYCTYKAWQHCCSKHQKKNQINQAPVDHHRTPVSSEQSSKESAAKSGHERMSRFKKLPPIEDRSAQPATNTAPDNTISTEILLKDDNPNRTVTEMSEKKS